MLRDGNGDPQKISINLDQLWLILSLLCYVIILFKFQEIGRNAYIKKKYLRTLVYLVRVKMYPWEIIRKS